MRSKQPVIHVEVNRSSSGDLCALSLGALVYDGAQGVATAGAGNGVDSATGPHVVGGGSSAAAGH